MSSRWRFDLQKRAVLTADRSFPTSARVVDQILRPEDEVSKQKGARIGIFEIVSVVGKLES